MQMRALTRLAFRDEHHGQEVLGRDYEYFLGQFARTEGKRGGQIYSAAWLRAAGPNSVGPDFSVGNFPTCLQVKPNGGYRLVVRMGQLSHRSVRSARVRLEQRGDDVGFCVPLRWHR